MPDETENDWTAAVPGSLLKVKEVGLRAKDAYRSVQFSAAILNCIKLRREKIRTAKPDDSEGQRQQDEKDDQQIFLGTMILLAARTRGK